MNILIGEASTGENTASECIRTVPATYGCKILQLYEHEANEYGYISGYEENYE